MGNNDNELCIPTKTPIGRSRRKKPVISTTKVTGSNNEKENYNSRTNNPISSVDDFLLDDHAIPSLDILQEISPSSSLPSSNMDSKEQQKRICQEFRQSLKRVSTPATIWKDHPDLIDTIVKVSLRRQQQDIRDGFVLIDTQHSSLLSLSRKLIKDATTEGQQACNNKNDQKGSNNQQQQQYDNLFVAVHTLRSISFTLSSTLAAEKTESVLKLFYHLITTAADERKNDNGESKNDNIRLGLIAIAGYEGLGYALSKYCLKQKGDTNITRFDLLYDETTGNKLILFAIPHDVGQKTKKTSVTTTPGTMNIRQVCTIAWKSTASIGNVLNGLLYYASKDNFDSMKPSNFGSLGNIMFHSRNSLHRVIIDIYDRVHTPWIQLLAKICTIEKDAIKDFISYSKAAHRMLWDTASKLKSIHRSEDTKYFCTEKECFEIRKHAILHLLPITFIAKLDAVVMKSSFENACTYAWKAASVFAQQASEDQTSVLEGFYNDITPVLEQMITYDSKVPMGYVEYVAYKSLHLPSSTIRLNEISCECNSRVDISSGDYRIVLNVIELIVLCKSRIELVATSKSSNVNYMGTIPLEMAILQSFNSQFLHRENGVTVEVANRIFKLLCSLSLQKTLFTASKGTSSALTSTERQLHLGAELLHCISTVGMFLVDASPETSSQILDMVTECFIRPLSIYEKLSSAFQSEGNNSSSFGYISLADEVCENYYETLTRLSQRKRILTAAAVEKGAKVRFVAILSVSWGLKNSHITF
jgi:hypothetical protein